MRKVNFKTLIATSLIMLALMVVGIGRGQAQNSMGSGGTGIYSFPAKVTFVGATQAENILNAHITFRLKDKGKFEQIVWINFPEDATLPEIAAMRL